MKGSVVLKVEQLLMNLTSFNDITKITSWDTVQIMNYIDSVFRYEHPEFYIENIKYFCWGQTDSELAEFNKKTYIRYIKMLKEELSNLKEEEKTK